MLKLCWMERAVEPVSRTWDSRSKKKHCNKRLQEYNLWIPWITGTIEKNIY